MTLRVETATDRWARMIRSTGVVGLITIADLFAPIIAISSLGEPPFVASAEAARTFFVNGSAGWAQLAEALTSLSAVGLIWFAGGLSLLLARGEGSPPWRSAVALVSGAIMWLPSPNPRSSSGNTWISVARSAPSGCFTVVTPMNDDCLT